MMHQHHWQRIESAAMDAWPAFEHVAYDGWMLRFAEAFTKRSNSVNPVRKSELPLEEKIAHCERLYCERGLPPIFRLTAFTDPSWLDDLLKLRGYRVLDPTQVMTRSLLSSTAMAQDDVPEITEHSLENWLDLVDAMSFTVGTRAEIRHRLLGTIRHARCCLIAWQSGHPVGNVLGIETNGFLGIFMLTVLPEVRRKGLGTTLTRQLLRWGIQRGLDTAYLQVEASNAAARTLYTACGFQNAYLYWYRIAGNESATLS